MGTTVLLNQTNHDLLHPLSNYTGINVVFSRQQADLDFKRALPTTKTTTRIVRTRTTKTTTPSPFHFLFHCDRVLLNL